MKKLIIHTDGGARGNPGPAAIGCVLFDPDIKEEYYISNYIGSTTNNQAEYRALLAALEKAQVLMATHVECYLDSELVVKQMRGEYRVRDKNLSPLYLKIWNLTLKFTSITFNHIPRAMNKKADSLVNKALDEYGTHS
ncbi:MAG: ribonuclease HI family protein [Patescibacteria group bacterium]